MRHIRWYSVVLSSILLAACASEDVDTDVDHIEAAVSSRSCPAGVPAALAPAADQDLAFVLHATGVQKYTCAATATGGYAWTFVAPEADLYRTTCQRHIVGTHYAGPTWEYQDGSTVVGARLAGATVDATAIPWLLLKAVSHGGSSGRMTDVTAIQRLDTVGGLAPATGCDATTVGAAADVAYSADYFFYRTRSAHPERNLRCGG